MEPLMTIKNLHFFRERNVILVSKKTDQIMALMNLLVLLYFVADNVKLGPDGAVLTIANARLNNQGGYRCIATNAQGKSTITANLSIRRESSVFLSC